MDAQMMCVIPPYRTLHPAPSSACHPAQAADMRWLAGLSRPHQGWSSTMKMTLLALLATLSLGIGSAFAQPSQYQVSHYNSGQRSYQYDIPGG
jgi:hypothetical protein